ncbi:MAG: CRISPR-associated helicase Cas3' [Bacteroidota bacterium]
MTKLLAKSEPQTTLLEHINDGLVIWSYLKKAFPSISEIVEIDFWKLLRLGVIFHDLGKGHEEFQKVLRGQKNEWKKQRHEFFSLPFVQSLPLLPIEKQLLERVVLGHHKTYKDLMSRYINDFYFSREDFIEEFDLVDKGTIFDLLEQFDGFEINQVEVEFPKHIIDRWRTDEVTIKDTTWITHLLLFGAFKHCDHLASAYIRKLYQLELGSFSFLEKKRIDLQKKGFDFYNHQKEAAQDLGNVILTAPTGSGKTETALLWLRKQMQNRGQGRVFYTLPFTASINAMYLRLSHVDKGFDEKKVGMLHGKLSAFLYDYFQDASSVRKRKEEIDKVKSQFQTLETPLKVLTPFQLLKHIFGLRGFEKGIFEWTGGYFIFDEIHAYDSGVFAQIKVLLEFLTQRMRASVLIMTATLPTFIKSHLKEAIGSSIEIKATNELYEEFDRHRIVLKEGLLKDNLNLIKSDLEAGRKVLVVCNTIDEAQNTYEKLKDCAPLLIHGSFNAEDRNDKEKQLSHAEPQLLIGTQAIEVSLDIDYDMIYTEPAPLDALIQRFGRVNRKREKGICNCYVFRNRNDSDEYIYAQSVIDQTIKALDEIERQNEGIIKEANLQNLIDDVYPDFDEKGKTEFESTYEALQFSIENNLKVFEHSRDREEDFYKQFDGIKVVPACLEPTYRSRLEEYDFIGAEQLKVSIRKGRFAGWMADESIESDSKALEATKRPDGLIQIQYFVLKKKYNSEMGLLKNEDDIRRFDEDSLV